MVNANNNVMKPTPRSTPSDRPMNIKESHERIAPPPPPLPNENNNVVKPTPQSTPSERRMNIKESHERVAPPPLPLPNEK